MFHQVVLPKFRFLSCIDIDKRYIIYGIDNLFTIGDRHWRKVAATFEHCVCVRRATALIGDAK